MVATFGLTRIKIIIKLVLKKLIFFHISKIIFISDNFEN